MASILVVDDQPVNRRLLVAVLENEGYRLFEATDGSEALTRIRAERPDLVIADILMPNMDGYELVRQIRADPAVAATRVVFHSAAYHEREARPLASACGVTQFLNKPARPEEILRVVDLALRVTPEFVAPASRQDDFDEEHLRLLTDKLSHHAAELESVNLRLNALVDLGFQLRAEHDQTRLLDTACQAARTIVGARFAAVAILACDGSHFDPFLASGAAAALDAIRPAPENELLSPLLSGAGPVRRHFPEGHALASGLPANPSQRRSFLGVPICISGRVLGVLYLIDRLSLDEFSEEDERLTITIADMIAQHYENLLRHEELERRVAERTAELRRSNAELEQFAFVAAHDLKEPLRKVVGYTQLLAESYAGKLGQDADEFIGYAVDGAKRMQDLIEDLLTYSRAGRRQMEFTVVRGEEVLERVLNNLRGAIDESGAVVSHDPLPELVADAPRLEQLFMNLIGNAIKFRGERPARIHVRAERQESNWLFSVRDNGIGIDPQFFDRVFVVFQRLHSRAEYPGTGIGLAICRKVVERHGGRIWIESQPGEGSVFYFTIPVVPTPSPGSSTA